MMAPGAMKQGTPEEPVDVLIVTAVEEEYQALRLVDGDAAPGSRWVFRKGPTGLEVAFRTFSARDGHPIRVAATSALEMGGVATANAAAPLVHVYRPRCIAMCGVCAGRRGKVELGDVIIADRLWTYDTGETVVERDEETGHDVLCFKADPFQYNLPPAWRQQVARFQIDPAATWLAERPRSYEAQMDWLLDRLAAGDDPGVHADQESRCRDRPKVIEKLWKEGLLKDGTRNLTAAGRKRVERLRILYPKGLPEPAPFKIHVGPIGTGTAVVKDPDIFDKLSKSMRKTIGLEMEAATIGAIAHLHEVERMIVMKGVMDFADPEKNDNFKAFAARASAECLLAFLRENLRSPAPREAEPQGSAPAAAPMPRWVTDLGFIEELARVFDTQEAAHHLLQRAGIPVRKLRPFHAVTPERYWAHVCGELASGRVSSGPEALVGAALDEYPGNRVFLAVSAAMKQV